MAIFLYDPVQFPNSNMARSVVPVGVDAMYGRLEGEMVAYGKASGQFHVGFPAVGIEGTVDHQSHLGHLGRNVTPDKPRSPVMTACTA